MKKNLIFLLGIVTVHMHASDVFSTLQGLQSYTARHEENVLSDNNNWSDPRYINYYKSVQPTFFTKMGRALGFITKPEWDAFSFKDLIKKVTQYRNEHKELTKDIITLPIKTGQKVVIFGDLHGTLHSLVRDLQELKNQGILDDNLMVQEGYHIIFLGNLVNRSPYSLEVLTTVITLMDKNPERVIYLAGKDESNKYWENFTMRRALQNSAQTAADPEDGQVPLETVINSFFKTLPRMVKITHADVKEEDAIYCVHNAITVEELRAKDVMAVIYGERYEDVNPSLELNGLRRIGFTYGTAMWSIMSSPVPLYQEFLHFYYDAFVILQMGKKIQQSIVTLYNNDVRTSFDYEKTSRDILFGRIIKDASEFTTNPLFINKPLDIGSTIDISGMAFSYGLELKRGFDLALRERNLDKGVQGHLILPTFLDDGYDPHTAKLNMNTLTQEYKISLIAVPMGTAPLLSYIDKIKSGEISVFFPVTGATILRNADLKNIIHFKASYQDEMRALIDYMIKEYGTKNFAFFYQTDAYGQDALAAAHRELKKYGITQWIDIPYSREQTDFREQADKVRDANPDALGLLSVSLPTQAFLGELGTDYLLKRHIFGASFLESDDLRRYLDDRGILYTFAFIVPDPAKSALPLVQDYRKAMDSIGARYSGNSLEGWIAAQLILDAMDHVTLPITRQKVMTYLEGLKNYDLGGLKLTFNPNTRSFELPVYIENEKNEFFNDTSLTHPATITPDFVIPDEKSAEHEKPHEKPTDDTKKPVAKPQQPKDHLRNSRFAAIKNIHTGPHEA